MVLPFDRRKKEGHVSFQKFEFDLNDEVITDQFNKLKKKLNMHEHSVPLKQLLDSLFSDLTLGLTESHAARLLTKVGKNRLFFFTNFSFIDLCKNFFGGFGVFLWTGTFIFLFAYIFTLLTENTHLVEYLWLGVFLTVFNILNSYFSIYQNEKTNQMFTSFKRLVVQKTIVTRSGLKFYLNSEKLVPGDLIELNEGNIVPADIRIVKAFNLKLDSFQNSVPEYKSALQTSKDPLKTKNLAFLGDHIYEGTGQGIVLRTGENTLYSHLAHMNYGFKLKAKKEALMGVASFMKRIKLAASIIGTVYFLNSYFYDGYSLLESAKFAIGLVIAMVPECLMITLSIALGLALKKLEKKNLLVKNIATIEKLGAISTICTDKSGTLTQNKMYLKTIWYNNVYKDLHSFELQSDVSLRRIIEIHPIIYDALLCTSVTFLENNNRPSMNRRLVGDPTDIAILRFIESLFGGLIDYQKLHPKVYEIPFNPINKFHMSIHESREGYRIVMKGAPELILERCSTIYIDEKSIAMTPAWGQKAHSYLTEMASKGHRVIGYCDSVLDPAKFPKSYDFKISELGVPNFPIGREMRFLGLISMLDTLRPNTRSAVRKCKSAGVRVIMITGDHPLTAESIAKAVDIITTKSVKRFGSHETGEQATGAGNAAVVDGAYLKKITDEQLDLLVRNYGEIVFARTTPLQKERIVASYQRMGEFVAVTGDGINDCPCLKKADIGIAMGITGADVSKEAADMILLDDNFATIQNAIEEGRLIHDNLKKSISHTLTAKIAVLSPFLMNIIWDIPLAIGTIGILMSDLVTDIIPPISLAFEKRESDLMSRSPVAKNERLVSFGMISVTYGCIGMLQASAGYLMYTEIMTSNGFFPSRLLGIRKSWDSMAINDLQDSYGQEWTYEQRKDLEFRCNTGFFFTILMLQIAYFFCCHTRLLSIFKHRKGSQIMYIALFLEVLLAAFFCYTPGLNDSLHMQPLELYRWMLVLLPYALHIVLFEEIRKFLIRKYPNSWFKNCFFW